MKIEKNKLVKVNYRSEKFAEKLVIKGTNGLILDTIKVIEYDRNISDIPYYISVKENGDILIVPIFAPGNYFVVAEMVVNANVLEIKSEDYIQHYSTMSGSFKFVFGSDVELQE